MKIQVTCSKCNGKGYKEIDCCERYTVQRTDDYNIFKCTQCGTLWKYVSCVDASGNNDYKMVKL